MDSIPQFDGCVCDSCENGKVIGLKVFNECKKYGACIAFYKIKGKYYKFKMEFLG